MEYLASIVANFLIYALIIISLNNFIIGKTSIWSIGHIAFFGIGALTTGIMVHDFLMPGWSAILPGLLISFFLSLFVGLSTLRLSGDYFIILSIGLCEITRAVSHELKGPAGMSGIVRPTLGGMSLDNDWMFILLVILPIFIAVIVLSVRFSRSPLERICSLVRQNENAARFMKINPLYYKVGCLCIGSLIAALTGSIHAFFARSTDPSIITLYQTVLFFSMVLFGGINSLYGSILGSLMLVAVPRILEYFINSPMASSYSYQIIQLMYGFLLIFVVRFMPQGVMGGSKNWFYPQENT